METHPNPFAAMGDALRERYGEQVMEALVRGAEPGPVQALTAAQRAALQGEETDLSLEQGWQAQDASRSVSNPANFFRMIGTGL